MRYDEENYEDELDRMRARKQRKSGHLPAPTEDDDDDFLIYEDVDDMEASREYELDDDADDYAFDYDYDDDGYEKRPAPARRKHIRKRSTQPGSKGTGSNRTGSNRASNTGTSNTRTGRTQMENTDRQAGKNRKLAQHKPPKRSRRRGFWEIFLLLAVLLAGYLGYKQFSDDGYWTIAVFGVDSREGKLGKGSLSDVEMICSIDKKTGEMRLVSVFRDTYLRIDNDDTYHKINEAFFKGGHSQAVEALEQNLDLKIDDYAVFNWKAVVDAINVLGGVDIEITDKEFAYINGFITETVKSTGVGSYQLEHSGMNRLDGVQAVAYARLRLMDTDFNRTERQRKVLGLAMDKAKAADFDTLKTLIGAVFPQVSTSIGVDDLIVMAKDARKYYIGQTSGFPFSHTEMKIGKMACVVPTTLESNVIQLHQFLYEDSSYTPSGMVRTISSHISEETGLGEPGKDIESDRTNSGQSSGGSQQPAATAPASQPQETPTETESLPESTEETSEGDPEETTIEASEESTEGEATEPEQSGPGIPTTENQEPETETPVPSPSATEEPRETTGALEGPGQGGGSSGESFGPGV